MREQEAELAAQVSTFSLFVCRLLVEISFQQEGRSIDPIEPLWFKLVPDPYNGGKMIHEYRGDDVLPPVLCQLFLVCDIIV